MYDHITYSPILLEKANEVIYRQSAIAKNNNNALIRGIEERNSRVNLQFYRRRIKKNFPAATFSDAAYRQAYDILSKASREHGEIDRNVILRARRELHNTHLLQKQEIDFALFSSCSLDAERLISTLLEYYMFVSFYQNKIEEEIVAQVLLSNLLHQLSGNSTLNVTRAIRQNYSAYKSHFEDFPPDEYIEYLSDFVEFILNIFLQQLEEIEMKLHVDVIFKKIKKFIISYNESAKKKIPIYVYPLLKEILIYGELARGDVAKVICMKDRTASSLITQLLSTGILRSPSAKGRLYIGVEHILL